MVNICQERNKSFHAAYVSDIPFKFKCQQVAKTVGKVLFLNLMPNYELVKAAFNEI